MAGLLAGGALQAGAPDWLPRERLSSGGLTLVAPPRRGGSAPGAEDSRWLRQPSSSDSRSTAAADALPDSAGRRTPPAGARALPFEFPGPSRVGLMSPAATPPPNLPVGEDPATLPPDRRAQAEPHLARSFADPNLLLATFQEGRFEDGGAVSCGYAVSEDGGTSWRRALIPGLVKANGVGLFDRASDPVAAVGGDGTLYLSTLGLRGEAPNWLTSITLHLSHDRGRTFEPPLIVTASTNSNLFLDKNWLAVNNFPATPTTGRLVVTLTRFYLSPIHGIRHPIALTFSDDQGETWSELNIISSDNCQGSQPVFLPDGSLAVAWWVFVNADRGSLRVRFSPDGGETFDPTREVAAVTPHRDPVARSAQFLPALTADRTLGGLYLVWQGTTDAPRVLFSRSRDQGRTWSAPVAVNDTPDGRSVFNPTVAVSPDGQHVTVIFYDKRHDDGSGRFVDLYLAESFDGGESWEANRRISSVSSDLSRAPLTPSGRMVGDYQGLVPALNLETPGVTVWVDTREDSPGPWSARIARARGASFAAWQRLAFADPDAPPARPEADADGDGLPNAVEYLVGGSPARPDPPALRAEPPREPGAAPAYAFRAQAVVEDVAPAWARSADLRHWEPATPRTTRPAPGPPAFRHWTVSFAPAGTAREFIRLGARERPAPPGNKGE